MPADPPVNMDRLTEVVKAASRMTPEKEAAWRRLVTRSQDEFKHGHGFQTPVRGGTPGVYAVELVPCEAGADGSVMLQRHSDESRVRSDAGALYDLWIERLPADAA